jgi:hypothetical protein
MILEGIVTTLCDDGSVNVSPMGPMVDEDAATGELRRFTLRPFRGSTTYRNLAQTGCGVLHVTDDVWLLAQTAVGKPEPMPATKTVREMAEENGELRIEAAILKLPVLTDACRWYAFRVTEVDERGERVSMTAQVVAWGRLRDFFGFNRAKHAVVEAAILATRVDILPREEILAEFSRLRLPVEKTGGATERRAFEFLAKYVGFTVPS